MQASSDSIAGLARPYEVCETSSRLGRALGPAGARVYALEYVQDFPRRRKDLSRFLEEAFNLDTMKPPLLR